MQLLRGRGSSLTRSNPRAQRSSSEGGATIPRPSSGSAVVSNRLQGELGCSGISPIQLIDSSPGADLRRVRWARLRAPSTDELAESAYRGDQPAQRHLRRTRPLQTALLNSAARWKTASRNCTYRATCCAEVARRPRACRPTLHPPPASRRWLTALLSENVRRIALGIDQHFDRCHLTAPSG